MSEKFSNKICGIKTYFSSTYFLFLDNGCCRFTEPIRRNQYNEMKLTRVENLIMKDSEILL